MVAPVLARTATADPLLGGVDINLRSLLSGEMSIGNYYLMSAMRGRVFTASSKNVTTPVVWEVTETIDITKPIFLLEIPTGTAVIPLSIQVYFEAIGTTTSKDIEMNSVIGTGGSRTSGFTSIDPVGTRSDVRTQSKCTAWVGDDDDTPIMVGSTSNLNYIWRDGEQAAVTKSDGDVNARVGGIFKYAWSALDESSINIAGPGSQWVVNQGSEAGSGYIQVQYLEFPSSELPS